MNERAAFMRAICDKPEDDTSRLVFADWLQEQGEDERAEFIRVQVELARIPARPQLHLFGVSLRQEPKFNKHSFSFRQQDETVKIETFITGDLVIPEEQVEAVLRQPIYDLPLGQETFYGAILLDYRRLEGSDNVFGCKFQVTGLKAENEQRRKELAIREAELLTQNCGLRWAAKELTPTGWFKSSQIVRWWGWHRGFVEELKCPSVEFFNFVDELYWRKEGVCHCCKGYSRDDRLRECLICGNQGRVHLPCPETAQPIRKVTLTDIPQLIFTRHGHFTWEGYPCHIPLPAGLHHPLDTMGMVRCLELTFPGLTFDTSNVIR